MPSWRNRCMGEPVTYPLLQFRAECVMRNGFKKPMWIRFCEKLLAGGCEVYLYEAKSTGSKYITVHYQGLTPYKIRFGDHKPSAVRQFMKKDCDFFVGKTHFGAHTTNDAMRAVNEHFRAELMKEVA